jgi:hypothetical protein
MGTPHKILAIASIGAVLAAFTALGLANPGAGAPCQEEGVKRTNPASVPQGDTTRATAAEDRKTLREDGGCGCCTGTKGACCSNAGGKPARGTVLLAQANPGSARPAAPQEKTKAKPKAGKEALAKGVATRKALLDQVSALMEDGVADCCIDPGCALCVIAADGCPCAGSLAKGGPVCPECWGGWQAGQGMLPDVKPEKVQILPKDQLKKIYGMRAEKLEQAGKK